eukprot:s1822_g8.t1
MKCALRFEKLILERRRTESCKDQNDQELLQEIVARYNGYKATAALKRWQIGPDMVSAILAVICGMCAEARQLVRLHLDFNKYDESGCLDLVVTPASQILHFQKYNYWWSMNAKKVKKSVRNRLRWSEETWGRNVDQCCLFVWACNQCRADPKDALRKAEYHVTITSLNHDFKEAVAFNQRRCKVLHMRDQIEIGLGVCEKFMEKRCLMVRQSDKSALTTFVRRVIGDANQKFQGVQVEKMHHVGFLDLSKYGRLTVPDINDAAQWCHQVLTLNENFSILAAFLFMFC